jgi:hypothetical protein
VVVQRPAARVRERVTKAVPLCTVIHDDDRAGDDNDGRDVIDDNARTDNHRRSRDDNDDASQLDHDEHSSRRHVDNDIGTADHHDNIDVDVDHAASHNNDRSIDVDDDPEWFDDEHDIAGRDHVNIALAVNDHVHVRRLDNVNDRSSWDAVHDSSTGWPAVDTAHY